MGTLLEADQASEHRPDNRIDNSPTRLGHGYFKYLLVRPQTEAPPNANTLKELRV